ncbi:MAG TPA: hypothetical protein VKZ77_13475 [Bacillaceae bacterium]|nr:hypothetical protein [Paenibacillus bovis]HLU23469.1 hypothetical protein [Bacillaceae bacterium]
MEKPAVYLMFILILIVTLFLPSCSKEHDHSHAHSIAMPFDLLGISEHGVLEVIDDVLWFHDFESGEKVVLCNKPDCPHEPYSRDTNPNPTCLAVLPMKNPFNAVGMYENHVYIFSSDRINHTIVYKENLDGDGREVLAEFDWEIYKTYENVVFQDGHAYFIGNQFTIDDEGLPIDDKKKLVVASLDLKNGDFTELSAVRDDHLSGIGTLRIFADKLYYQHVYFNEEMDFMAEDAIEKIKLYGHAQMYEIDLATNKEKLILDLDQENGTLQDLDGKYLYFLSDDQKKVSTVSLNDFSRKTLFEGNEISQPRILGDGIVYSQDNLYDGTLYFYDFNTNKTTKIKRPEQETNPLLAYDDWIVTSASIDDGEFHNVLIKRKDYLEGKDNYIVLN